VAFPVCSRTSRHSSSVCLAGSKEGLPHRANPTDLRHPCGTTDALIVPKHPGIKPFSASTADASLRSDAGIAPATFESQVRRSTIELITYETCASGGVVNFWLTLCHTPPVLPVPGHTELQDFRRNARTVSLDSAKRCPVTSGSTRRPLPAKLEPMGCPCPFTVAVWRECRARRDR
jgi:hypothetical protein